MSRSSETEQSPAEVALAAILELVRDAARQGAASALASHKPPEAPAAAALVDKQGISHALGVSTATIDRLCRSGRIPYVTVGDARRFDVAAVRSSLATERSVEPQPRASAPASAREPAAPPGVRLLSRRRR